VLPLLCAGKMEGGQALHQCVSEKSVCETRLIIILV
jgi:hypothetical protein